MPESKGYIHLYTGNGKGKTTSTFKFKNAQDGADCFSGKSNGYIYTRIGNPTIRAFEKNIADLDFLKAIQRLVGLNIPD